MSCIPGWRSIMLTLLAEQSDASIKVHPLHDGMMGMSS